MATRVLALASGVTTLESHRLGLSSLTYSAGTLTGRSGLYPAHGAGNQATVSAMVCSVAPFNAWIDGTNTSTQGGYLFCLDATENITFDAGNASTARVDRIIARVKDNPYDGSGATAGEVAYWKGSVTTGAATALPANSLLLYEVTVPAGTTAGGGGINFSTATVDKRVYTAASGGIPPIYSSTDRSGITTPANGSLIYRSDTDTYERYNTSGATWRGIVSKLVDATNVTITPIITPAAFSSETNIPRMQLSGSIETGSTYLFTGQGSYSFTAADTEADIYIRVGTALTGTIVGTIRLGRPAATGYGLHFSWSIPWIGTSTGTQNFYFSVKRNVGTGNISLDGGTASFSGLYLVGPGGTIRNVST